MQDQAQVAKDAIDFKKTVTCVAFVEPEKHSIANGSAAPGQEEAARVAKSRQMLLVLEKVLDLDGDVVSELGKLTVQPFHNRYRMPNAVEKVGVAEGDVPRPCRPLLANVC